MCNWAGHVKGGALFLSPLSPKTHIPWQALKRDKLGIHILLSDFDPGTFPFSKLNCIWLSSLISCRENEYTEAVFAFSNLFIKRIRFVPFHFGPIFHLSPDGFKWRKILKLLHGTSMEAIRKRRQELKELNTKGLSVTKRGKYLDFLDILLQARVSIYLR